MTDEELLKAYEPKPTKTLEHNRQVWCARYSPSGKLLVAGGYDGLVHRWDVSAAEPKLLTPLAGHHAWVQALAFHPKEDRLFSSDSWGQLSAWQAGEESPKPLWNVPQALGGWIRDVAVSPDGTRVAVAGNDAAVKIYNTTDGKLAQSLDGHPDDVFSVAWHPDGKSLVTGDLRGIIRQFSVESGKEVRKLEAKVLYQLDRLQDCGGVRKLAFSADGATLLAAGQKTPGGGFAVGLPAVLLFDWESGKLKQEMQVGDNQQGFVYDTLFHPAGFVMAVSCAMPNTGNVWFWQPGAAKAFFISKGLPNGRSLSLHTEGKRMAMAVSVAQNANGKPKGEVYNGGSAKIHLLEFPAPAEPAKDAPKDEAKKEPAKAS